MAAQVITDFFDVMKSRSRGYASMEYSVSEYRENDLVRLDILINGDCLSMPCTNTPLLILDYRLPRHLYTCCT